MRGQERGRGRERRGKWLSLGLEVRTSSQRLSFWTSGFLVYFLFYICKVCVSVWYVHLLKSEDNFEKSVLSYLYVGPGDKFGPSGFRGKSVELSFFIPFCHPPLFTHCSPPEATVFIHPPRRLFLNTLCQASFKSLAHISARHWPWFWTSDRLDSSKERPTVRSALHGAFESNNWYGGEGNAQKESGNRSVGRWGSGFNPGLWNSAI